MSQFAKKYLSVNLLTAFEDFFWNFQRKPITRLTNKGEADIFQNILPKKEAIK